MGRTLRVTRKGGTAKKLALVNPEILEEQFNAAYIKWDGSMKILDIYARDEAYLKFIEDSILVTIKDDKEFDAPTEEGRIRMARKHIRENQLWAICPYKECVDRINEYFGNEIPEDHIILYPNAKNKYLNMELVLGYLADYYESLSGSKYNSKYEKENKFMKSTFNPETYKMGFNLVVGCIPEGEDTYNEYMYHARRLASDMAVLTVPNHWLINRKMHVDFDGNTFNRGALSYMWNGIYYNDSKLVLGKDVLGGLSCVVFNSYRGENVGVRYVDDRFTTEDYDNYRLYRKSVLTTFNPVVYEVAKRMDLKDMPKLEVKSNVDITKYRVAVGEYCGGDCYYDEDGKLKGVHDYIVLKPNEECPKLYRVLFAVESQSEAESLISYLKTSVIRYILAHTMMAELVSTKKNWSTIPAPPSLDKKWTNSKVYTFLNLKKCKDVIEATMKEV